MDVRPMLNVLAVSLMDKAIGSMSIPPIASGMPANTENVFQIQAEVSRILPELAANLISGLSISNQNRPNGLLNRRSARSFTASLNKPAFHSGY